MALMVLMTVMALVNGECDLDYLDDNDYSDSLFVSFNFLCLCLLPWFVSLLSMLVSIVMNKEIYDEISLVIVAMS